MDNESAFKHTYNRLVYQAELALERESVVVIGTWVEDGKIVFDLCNVIDDEQEALALAAKRGERAIFDLEEQREISVNTGA
jgi:hypothetical protein